MAKANWVNLSAESGSGPAVIDVSANPHTGREPRTTQLTWVGNGVSESQVRTVIQQGSPVMIGSWPQNVSTNYAGATLRITGHTNAEQLKFVLGTGETDNLDVILPNCITAAGSIVNISPYWDSYTKPMSTSRFPIPGDPGATSAYDFTLDIEVPENRGETKLQRKLTVFGPTDNIFAICTIYSDNDFPRIEIPEGEIVLSYLGSKVSIQIQSNTDWQIK